MINHHHHQILGVKKKIKPWSNLFYFMELVISGHHIAEVAIFGLRLLRLSMRGPGQLKKDQVTL